MVPRRHDELGWLYGGMPITELELRCGDPSVARADEIDEAAADEAIPRLGTMSAGVHANCATDRSWDADGPLEACPSGRCRAAGEDRIRRCRSRHHLRLVELDRGEVLAEMNADAVPSPVGDKKVGSLADHEHRHGRTR